MRIVVLPGDGIGPEITAATVAVLERSIGAFRSASSSSRTRSASPASNARARPSPTRSSRPAARADGILLGPVSHLDYPPREQGGINPSGDLRIKLDLYANIRPSRSRDGLPHWGRTPMDLVIVRENTEGFYTDRNMHLGHRRVHADARRGALGAQDHGAGLATGSRRAPSSWRARAAGK